MQYGGNIPLLWACGINSLPSFFPLEHLFHLLHEKKELVGYFTNRIGYWVKFSFVITRDFCKIEIVRNLCLHRVLSTSLYLFKNRSWCCFIRLFFNDKTIFHKILSLLQLQDAGCWTDAATLAATHLQGSDYARCVDSFCFREGPSSTCILYLEDSSTLRLYFTMHCRFYTRLHVFNFQLGRQEDCLPVFETFGNSMSS